jgi:aldose 1-epimerase
MQSREFGRMPDGTAVHEFTLGGAGGLSATIIEYGGRIATLSVPTASGPRNVNLGCGTLEAWLADRSHLGALAGRYANRIGGGRFVLDGKEYRLPQNNGANTLHGGPGGFAYRVWTGEPDGDALLLRLTSADGDQGFPGKLDVEVRYAIEGAALSIDYTARTDAPTVLNLTNHAYFNLEGAGRPSVFDHVLEIPADTYTATDAALIPTGELASVANTPLDFRAPRRIGDFIAADFDPVRIGGGYDQNFVLGAAPTATPTFAARVTAGGIAMEVLTTEPGVQLYTGNWLGAPFARYGALCLETQHFANSPNRPEFPSTALRPGEVFRSRTLYRFARA